VAKPSIGLWRSWALVAGMMIGSGIYTLPSLLAAYGSNSFIGWGVTAFGALCLALTYAYLSSRQSGLGGPYFYVQQAFGAGWASLIALGYWFSLVSAVAALAFSFAGYSKTYLPWIHQSSLHSAGFAVSVVVVFLLINIRGIREAAAVQLMTTIAKIIPLLLIGVMGLVMGDIDAIPAVNPGNASTLTMISSLCLLIMWAFIGVESATLPSEDTISPEKTIPRASILGTLSTTAVYVIAAWGLMSVMPLELLKTSSSPFADAAQRLFGGGGEAIVTVGALFAIGGTLNVCLMMSGTILLAGSRDGLLPRWINKQDARGTPVAALLCSGIVSIIMVLFNTHDSLLKGFEIMMILSTFGVLMVYLATGLASLALQWRSHKSGELLYPIQIFIALLATIFSVLAIAGAVALEL